MSSLKPINRSRLELIDESKGWTPGAFVKGKAFTGAHILTHSDDEFVEDLDWTGGLGTIIAALDEGIVVLWSKKPMSTDTFTAPYVPLQVTPTIRISDVKKMKGIK